MNTHRLFQGKVKAFTLTELLIVLAIVGILVLLALPNLMPKVTEAKAQEAKLQLKHVYTLQKTHFMVHSKYSETLDDIGFEHAKLVKDGGTANYQIDITEASSGGFKARATAVVDFNGDGQFNQWEIDDEMNLKEVQKD